MALLQRMKYDTYEFQGEFIHVVDEAHMGAEYTACGIAIPDEKAQDFLKSLKERYTWKPSDEQMEMLRIVTERSLEDTDKKEREIIGTTLGTLCDDLKKLKG